MLCLSGELRAKTPRNEGKTRAESESEGDHWGDTTTRAWWGFRSGFPAEAALSSQHFPCPTCATSVSHPCHPHVPSVPHSCPTCAMPCPSHAIPLSFLCHLCVPPVQSPCPTRATPLSYLCRSAPAQWAPPAWRARPRAGSTAGAGSRRPGSHRSPRDPRREQGLLVSGRRRGELSGEWDPEMCRGQASPDLAHASSQGCWARAKHGLL